jgi:16S rRNA (cytidine1402-2'-O)-methyltransferase
MTPGRLILVPTPLDFGAEPQPLAHALPQETIAIAARTTHWIAESAKSARAFLKRVDALVPLAAPLQAQHIAELPRQAHKHGDHTVGALDAAARALLSPAAQGHDIGLLSEAGMPAVADPGSSVVRAAHAMGLTVVPLVGPVSLMLALAASGLNGQHFAFVGYVPQDAAARSKRLRELEAHATRSGQTQILIETPYRNAALLQALLEQLQPGTRLAVVCALGLPQQAVRSAPVAQWRQHTAWREALPLSMPAVILFGP